MKNREGFFEQRISPWWIDRADELDGRIIEVWLQSIIEIILVLDDTCNN